MAPRKRARKAGTRMDAALDALGARGLGFEHKVIRKTVNDLLEVYGGNDGWIAVQEDCYKLVIDTIIDEQEKDEKQLLIEGCSQKEEDTSLTVVTKLDDAMEEDTSLAIVTKLEDVVEEDKCLAIAPSEPTLAILPCSSKTDSSEQNQYSSEIHSPLAIHSPLKTSSSLLALDMKPCTSNSKQQSSGSALQAETRVPQLRTPCCGWIDDDDDDDEED